MISGKSMILIRAACSVTGASAAASLGQETRPLSIQYPQCTIPKSRRYPLPITTGEATQTRSGLPSAAAAAVSATSSSSTDDWNFNTPSLPVPNDADRLETFNNSLHSIPHEGGVGGIVTDEGARDGPTKADDEETKILSSVKYWARLVKSFNGFYAGGNGGSDGGDDEVTRDLPESSNRCPSGDCGVVGEGNSSNEPKEEVDKTSSVCRFCHSLPHRIPSPTSFKDTTLNTVTASRHLFLVRHGQYHNNRKLERDRCLTRIGREQLKHTGNRLREIGASYSRIVASTMKRAQESAEIILKCIGNVPMGSDPLLEEGAPIVPEPPLPNWKPNQKQYQTDGERIETAFRKYFRKADISQSNDVNEIVVCHANVIRYFVCRALEAQPEAWLRLWLNHGSITWLTIKPSGRVVLNAMGASGYMPPNKLTAT